MSTNSNVMKAPVQRSYEEVLLSTPTAHLNYSKLATPYSIKQRSGKTVRMRRYNRLETAPVPVDPLFMTPAPQAQTAVDIDATLNWYSDNVVITREVTTTHQDPVLTATVVRQGQSLRETEDELMRSLLESTASSVNATGGSNGDSPTEITIADVNGITVALQGADGEFISDLRQGEDRFGTGPIFDSYVALAHNALIPRINAITGFLNKAQYPNQKSTVVSEWGNAGNLRFFLSSRGSVTKNASLLGADVYNTFIPAEESYATVTLDGDSTSFYYYPPGSGDDVGHLRSKSAWTFSHAKAITNNAWVLNLRSTL